MPNQIKPLIAGNWKMNGLVQSLNQISVVADAFSGSGKPNCDCVIFPPATLLSKACALSADSTLVMGAQDCHAAEKGAYTGDVSAPMIVDAGAKYVLVGHSERRVGHGETNDLVNAKARAALSAGLTPIICIGESKEQREQGDAIPLIEHQLAGSVPQSIPHQDFVIAYEPVWAIGTGLIPTEKDILDMHAFIREWFCKNFGEAGEITRILYGGSMNPGNAAQILPLSNVNGGLIGGASLKATDFLAIIAEA